MSVSSAYFDGTAVASTGAIPETVAIADLSAWAQWLARAVAQTVAERLCRPTATYRLQFEPRKMTFRDAAGLVPYLDELGVSHLYASPYLKARSGSTHGYAIVDYGSLNPELGSEGDYRAMVETLHARAMGQILDTVPNHMSATPAENLWWTDVLENGPASPRAAYFDIDWHPVKEELRNKVLLPILGDQYGQVLESGELKLEYADGAFFLRTGSRSCPSTRGPIWPFSPPARRPEGEPAPGLRGLAGTGEHRHGPGAPAAAHGNRAGQGCRAATREGGHQGPPPRAGGPRRGGGRVHPPQRAGA